MADRTRLGRIRAPERNGLTRALRAKRGGEVETPTGAPQFGSDPGQKPDSGRRRRALSFCAVGVLALVSGGVVAACSSGSSTSSNTTGTASSNATSTTSAATTACKTANTEFDNFISLQKTAADAQVTAVNTWHDYDATTGNSMPSPSSPELSAAIDQFNTDNQKAMAAEQSASQALAQYQASFATCNQVGLPKACQGDFAAHQPLTNDATRLNADDATAVQAILAQQQAYRAGDATAYNAQTASYNSAVNDFNSAKDAWNSDVGTHSSAVSTGCTSALGI